MASPSPPNMKSSSSGHDNRPLKKPPFRPAQDDTKPPLQDPITRSDPIETDQALLRLPPFPQPRAATQ